MNRKVENMKKEMIFSNIIFWLTLISPLLSFALVCKIGEADIFSIAGMVRYSWVMLLFIPIGILSILIGFKLKANKQKYKKNFIVSFICIPLLVIFGSYRFIFSTNISYDLDKINTISYEAKIELPKQVKIATIKYDEYSITYAKIINEDDKVKFENKLDESLLWKNELDSKFKFLLPYYFYYEVSSFDYFILYNKTIDEYNIYPQNGEYEFIFISYDHEAQRFIILDDYKIELSN